VSDRVDRFDRSATCGDSVRHVPRYEVRPGRHRAVCGHPNCVTDCRRTKERPYDIPTYSDAIMPKGQAESIVTPFQAEPVIGDIEKAGNPKGGVDTKPRDFSGRRGKPPLKEVVGEARKEVHVTKKAVGVLPQHICLPLGGERICRV